MEDFPPSFVLLVNFFAIVRIISINGMARDAQLKVIEEHPHKIKYLTEQILSFAK